MFAARKVLARKMPGLGTFVESRMSLGSYSSQQVVRQLIFEDEEQVAKSKWCPLRNCLDRTSILLPVRPAGLIRQEDIDKFGQYIPGPVVIPMVKDLCGLIAVNLMKGVNVESLIRLDNLLWSTSLGGIMFKTTELEAQSYKCPYRAVNSLLFQTIRISTNLKPQILQLPFGLKHLSHYLQNACMTDKRLITNHSVLKTPAERMARNSTINQILRHDLPYERTLRKRLKEHGLHCDKSFETIDQTSASVILSDLGSIFPDELLTPGGTLHPMVDIWAEIAQADRDKNNSKKLNPPSGCPGLPQAQVPPAVLSYLAHTPGQMSQAPGFVNPQYQAVNQGLPLQAPGFVNPQYQALNQGLPLQAPGFVNPQYPAVNHGSSLQAPGFVNPQYPAVNHGSSLQAPGSANSQHQAIVRPRPGFKLLVELGNILVALNRDPFEHIYSPYYSKLLFCLQRYDIFQVEQLVDFIMPDYGPRAEKSFMDNRMWHLLHRGLSSRPPYKNWTN